VQYREYELMNWSLGRSMKRYFNTHEVYFHLKSAALWSSSLTGLTLEWSKQQTYQN